MRDRRLARDPLADLLPPEGQAATTGPEQDPARGHSGAGGPRSRRGHVGRDRITVQVEQPLAEQVRDAVMWLHRVGVHTTISAIAAAGLRTELERLAALHNEGRPFPSRQAEVPVGRPPRS